MKRIFFVLLLCSIIANVVLGFFYYREVKLNETQLLEYTLLNNQNLHIIDSIKQGYIDNTYFNLENNDQALDRFDFQTLDRDLDRIKGELFALNQLPKGNPLIPYEEIKTEKNLINKILLLNHRWIIADYYCGGLRGELLIKYFFDRDKPTEFITMDSVLYSN